MLYVPPTPDQLEQFKQDLNLSSGQMAALLGLANGRQWRRYLSNDPENRRDMGMHMLFFAVARIELGEQEFARLLEKMRSIGAEIALEDPSSGDTQ